MEEKQKVLVLDSAAILMHMNIDRINSKIYTVPEVVKEIKDEKSKAFLHSLGDALILSEPTAQSLAHVIQFAKATGDFASLSKTDLKVLALTYQLDVEMTGGEGLREAPHTNQISAKPNVTIVVRDTTKRKGKGGGGGGGGSGGGGGHVTNNGSDGATAATEAAAAATPTTQVAVENAGSNSPSAIAADNDINNSNNNSNNNNNNNNNKINNNNSASDTALSHNTASAAGENDDDSDGGGWITPSNIKKVTQKLKGAAIDKSAEDASARAVRCITSDYAMQNVLIQMGLSLSTPDGQRVKHVKQWLLKCYACQTIVRDTSRRFCTHCGNHTLRRLAVKVNEDGSEVHFYSKNKGTVSTRGARYTIPLPKGGRHNTDYILAEDVYERRLRQHGSGGGKKKGRDLDDFDADLAFAGGRSGGGSVKIGAGRRNPNKAKKRAGKKNKSFAT